jgi:outer membrane protein assembly factor BamB
MAHVRGTVVGAPGGGVVCSDGRSVARTAPDGSFELDAAGPFVFLCVPTGHTADRWYLPADGELRFELRPREQPVPFSFAQITDLHLSVAGWVFGADVVTTPASVTELLAEIAAMRSDIRFVVSTGDQTNGGTDDEYAAYLDAVASSPLPVVAIPGNHDHNSADVSQALADGARWGPGVAFTPYDRLMGPRWFSFDHGGVHFVAIDWTTHHLGLEADVQEAWVRADLAEVDPATPVIFLTHDLMSSEFFERVGAAPVASFSGHWHTTRVVEAGGALHVNTAPATYGGLDYSPAHWRIVTWDGERVSVETVRREAPSRPARTRARWAAELSGAANRAGPVAADGVVIAAFGDEERAGGGIEAFDVATGERVWTVRTSSAVKATPLVSGDAIVAAAVTGETVCVEASTGRERWRREIDDPLRLWTYLRPATDGRLVFIGDTARFVALDLADGHVVWSRDDLGVRGNITCHAHPIVVDGVLIVSFAAQVPDLWMLDAATGATLRPTDVAPASVYDLPPEQSVSNLMRGPVSGYGRDPDTADVYVQRLGNVVDRIRVADGDVVWTAKVQGWFNPAIPVADGDHLFVCEGTGALVCLDRADGTHRWRTEVTSGSPLRMAPYRDAGGALFADPVPMGADVLTACGDGRLVAVARTDGAITGETDVGAPIVATPAIDGSSLFVVAMDGVLRAIAIEDVIPNK